MPYVDKKVYGKDHPFTSTSYNNIGLMMIEKGDYDGSLNMYYKCLAIREKVYGKDHPDTAITYNNIGLVMFNKGDYDRSLEIFDKRPPLHP